ncbi:hypothetical protein EJB05_19880 [Eragrostis curvula]|uniref:Uncharacterized protein n=1 Tax=Eragrostis curvula TaxID=38414 RepID=A0A5J9UYJ1_9POAL|nr:hypothetical protein EJB05_19880 [Eragrostis curvula]
MEIFSSPHWLIACGGTKREAGTALLARKSQELVCSGFCKEVANQWADLGIEPRQTVYSASLTTEKARTSRHNDLDFYYYI